MSGASAELGGGWVVWSRFGDLIASNFPDIARVYFERGVCRLQLQDLSILDGTALAVSEVGEMVVGTSEGRVLPLFSDESLPDVEIPTNSAKAIRSIAFVDKSALLVGGDFQGLYLYDKGQLAHVLSSPREIRLLDIHDGRVAYAGGGRIGLVPLQSSTTMSDRGQIIFAILSAAFSILAIWFAVVQDASGTRDVTAMEKPLSR